MVAPRWPKLLAPIGLHPRRVAGVERAPLVGDVDEQVGLELEEDVAHLVDVVLRHARWVVHVAAARHVVQLDHRHHAELYRTLDRGPDDVGRAAIRLPHEAHRVGAGGGDLIQPVERIALEPRHRMVDAAHHEVSPEAIEQAPIGHEEARRQVAGGPRDIALGKLRGQGR
jgi:hypothetical protein